MSTGTEHPLTGTAVVVTGGARGLGRAMSEKLAGAGASVLVVDIDQEPIEEFLEEMVGQTVGSIAGHRGDISDEHDIAQVVQHSLDAFGRIDVVVNNAGIGMSTIRAGDRYANPVRFDELEPAAVRRFLEVHVMGPFLLAKAALPHMVAQEFGRIVTVTTSLSTMLAGGQAPYGPAKAASEAFTAAMASDLSGSAVTANVLVPGGAADTRYVPDVPGRPRSSLVNPVVMGPPIVFLASRESSGVNGRRIIAKFWDQSVPAAEALKAASSPIGWRAE